MGIVLGWVCLLCICLLAAKVFTRKFKVEKADSFLKKIHKPVTVAAVLTGILHMALVHPVMMTRHISVSIAGLAAVLALLILIVLCHTIRKNKQRNVFVHRLLTVVVLVCAAAHLVLYVVDYKQYQKKIADIEMEEIVLSDIPDGTYTGKYDAGYINAEVEVTMQNGQIQDITILKHQHERGEDAETVVEQMVSEQRIDVDTVSGATNSSLVIKKAVQNALTQAVEK